MLDGEVPLKLRRFSSMRKDPAVYTIVCVCGVERVWRAVYLCGWSVEGEGRTVLIRFRAGLEILSACSYYSPRRLGVRFRSRYIILYC